MKEIVVYEERNCSYPLSCFKRNRGKIKENSQQRGKLFGYNTTQMLPNIFLITFVLHQCVGEIKRVKIIQNETREKTKPRCPFLLLFLEKFGS